MPLSVNFDSAVKRHDAAIYVHYPFCVRKCPYCDFASVASKQDPDRDRLYTDLLISELQVKKDLLQGKKCISLYIGGGTPSLCSEKELVRLLEAASPFLESDAEISFEANPGTVDLKKLQNIRAAGFNRISIGVQSFNDISLKKLGRIHSAEEAETACRNALKAGFDNFNIDIMHGLPGQSLSDGMKDLERALSLNPSHISWYELTLEEGTAFGRNPPQLPDEETLSDMESAGFALLDKAGFEHYEVSGFAAGKNKRCLHNQNYWLFGDYLGLGAAAHQKVSLRSGELFKVIRSANPEKIKEYGDFVNFLKEEYDSAENNASYLQAAAKAEFIRDRDLTADGRVYAVAGQDLPFEYMLNRLRLYADPIRPFETELHTDIPFSFYKNRLAGCEKEGLVQEGADGSVVVTDMGRIMLNEVICAFLNESP